MTAGPLRPGPRRPRSPGYPPTPSTPGWCGGLDYYTRTTFEYAGLGLESAQNALGGGGRYDGLVSAMGGPDTPAVGFALGVERILMAVAAEEAGQAVDRRLSTPSWSTSRGEERPETSRPA